MSEYDPDSPITTADLRALSERFELYKEATDSQMVMVLEALKGLATFVGMHEESIDDMRQELGLPVADKAIRDKMRAIFDRIAKGRAGEADAPAEAQTTEDTRP